MFIYKYTLRYGNFVIIFRVKSYSEFVKVAIIAWSIKDLLKASSLHKRAISAAVIKVLASLRRPRYFIISENSPNLA